MRFAYVVIHAEGRQIAERLLAKFGGGIVTVAGLREAYASVDALVFLIPAQLTIRLLAPIIESRVFDPAVLLVDPTGRFVVPLLAGQQGDADRIAEAMAAELKGFAVVTTSTENTDMISFEEMALRNQLTVENHRALKHIQTLLQQGASVELHTDHDIEWETTDPNSSGLRVLQYDAEDARMIRRGWQMCAREEVPAVFLTSRELKDESDDRYPDNLLLLRPRDIVLGISCRSRSNPDYVYQTVRETLERQSIPESAIRLLATGSIKAAEPALTGLAERLGVQLIEVPAADLRKVDFLFMQAPFTQHATKSENVAASSAYIASGRGRMLLVRASHPGGVTVAVAQERVRIRL